MAGNFIFNKKIMSVEPIVIISTYPSHEAAKPKLTHFMA